MLSSDILDSHPGIYDKALEDITQGDSKIEGYMRRLGEMLELIASVILTRQNGEYSGESKVPAEEKVVSIFEPHTDIIVKRDRETLLGHKIALMAGKSSMILDCMILKGNPSDESLPQKLVVRQKDFWRRIPLQIAFD